jgi:hypothetical protein
MSEDKKLRELSKFLIEELNKLEYDEEHTPYETLDEVAQLELLQIAFDALVARGLTKQEVVELLRKAGDKVGQRYPFHLLSNYQ